ncbi:MAG: hypothetical protein ACK55I_19020, partial [bacterium]
MVVGEARAARRDDETPRPVDMRQSRDALRITQRRGGRGAQEQRERNEADAGRREVAVGVERHGEK